jgi:hypothetical protein
MYIKRYFSGDESGWTYDTMLEQRSYAEGEDQLWQTMNQR